MKLSPEFLEVVNFIRLVLCVSLMGLFGRYIWLEFARQVEAVVNSHDMLGWPVLPAKQWWEAITETWANRRAAIAMLGVFTGEGMIALAVWTWRHFDLPTGNPFVAWGAVLGIVTFIVGCMCGIRNFCPERWRGWRPWITIPAVGAFVAVLLAILH